VKKSSPIPKALESPQAPTADEIAELSGQGEDLSRYFTNTRRMMPTIQLAKKKPAALYTKYDIVKR